VSRQSCAFSIAAGTWRAVLLVGYIHDYLRAVLVRSLALGIDSFLGDVCEVKEISVDAACHYSCSLTFNGTITRRMKLLGDLHEL
jgi:hypothetical protein